MARDVVYGESLTGIRYEDIYDHYNIRSESRYYDQKGKLIGKSKKDENYNINGTEVTYFYHPMRVSCIKKFHKSIIKNQKCFYGNGNLKMQMELIPEKSSKKISYNEKGEKLGEIIYKYDESSRQYLPYEGKEIQIEEHSLQMDIVYTAVYKGGKLQKYERYDGDYLDSIIYEEREWIKERTTQKKGEQSHKLIYKDGMPHDGKIVSMDMEITYKEGVEMEKK